VSQRGAINVLGLVAIFAATAVLLTVVMLFVTGVAQRTIIPRLQQRAEQAVAEPAEGAASSPAAAEPSSAPPPAGSEATPFDSLRALRAQIRVEQARLEARSDTLAAQIAEWKQLRAAAENAAGERVAALAKIYATMKPEAAARALVRLDDETFERVLARIDRRQAGKILSLIDPERVARLTRRAARPTGVDAS